MAREENEPGTNYKRYPKWLKDNDYVTYSEKKGITKKHLKDIGEDVLRKLGASEEDIAKAKAGLNEDELDYEIVNDFGIDAIKDNFTPPGAKSQKEDVKEEIDTNDNGEIEVDEMADFQKSLDDYAAKNKKGRDDIPVTTRR